MQYVNYCFTFGHPYKIVVFPTTCKLSNTDNLIDPKRL